MSTSMLQTVEVADASWAPAKDRVDKRRRIGHSSGMQCKKTLCMMLLLWVCAVCVFGCKNADAPSTSSAAASAAADGAASETPPTPVVTDDATQLLFSYMDERGNLVATEKASEVPDAVKAKVLVVDLAKTPEQRQAHRYAFFADLTTKRPDGSYAVSVVSRYDAAKSQASADAPAAMPPSGDAVVVYSATWCGYCKKAKAWLTQRGVPFVERDVEKTPGAQAELTQKLQAARAAGGGIPVIDWRGTLVMGFDQAKMEQLLSAEAKATGP